MWQGVEQDSLPALQSVVAHFPSVITVTGLAYVCHFCLPHFMAERFWLPD